MKNGFHPTATECPASLLLELCNFGSRLWLSGETCIQHYETRMPESVMFRSSGDGKAQRQMKLTTEKKTVFDRLLHDSEGFIKPKAVRLTPSWLCCCWVDKLYAHTPHANISLCIFVHHVWANLLILLELFSCCGFLVMMRRKRWCMETSLLQNLSAF